MKVKEVKDLCPFCRRNCNCNACLHSTGVIEVSFPIITQIVFYPLLPLIKIAIDVSFFLLLGTLDTKEGYK